MTMLDKFTEEISHFIGSFHASLEHARAREAYSEFAFHRVDATVDKVAVNTSEFAAPYDLLGFDPDFGYRSPVPIHPEVLPKAAPIDNLTLARSVGYHVDIRPAQDIENSVPTSLHLVQDFTLEIEAPGSVVNHFSQVIALSDDDYFNIGGHGLTFRPEAIDDAAVHDAAEQAAALSPLGDLARPGSADAVIDVIKTIMNELEDVPEGGDALQIHITGESIDGIYVNGELVTDAPLIEDHHLFKGADGASEPSGTEDASASISQEGIVSIEASVEVQTGGNTLINNAVLQNIWTGATITLVAGDHVEVDAIVQVNTLWDEDTLTATVSPLTEGAASNELFNIATFDHLETPGDDEPGASDDYPSFWAVTEIHGDLMIVNWLEQIIFMSDDDVGILSSSGVSTSVIAGDNVGVNHASVLELGFTYDLIIIGGSVFDANIIHQMNVLFDNDVVGATANFQTAGEASVSSAGNLLWNQARIGTIGDQDRFDSLSQDQLDTIASCENGDPAIASGLLTDEAFAGLQGLRVLYISGDLINLQYIRQTNILGDSDQIALAMDAIAPNLDADWTIETGSNALVNSATIIDLDSVGKTFIGGQQYSQETLFQAQLISTQPDFGTPASDALVSEAVLFLEDSMLTSDDYAMGADPLCPPLEYEAHTGDGVNSVMGH